MRTIVDNNIIFRILMTEAYSTLSNTLRYYGNVSNGAIVQYGSQIPFNFQLFNVNISSSACDFRKTIADWLNNMPNGAGIHANWVVSTQNKHQFINFIILTEIRNKIENLDGKSRSAKNCFTIWTRKS